jgi:two-component system, NtrC family, response regulator HydG
VRVLLLDPDPGSAHAVREALGDCELCAETGQTDGLRLAAAGGWDLILLDASFTDRTPELIGRLLEHNAATSVVVLAAHPSLESTIAAMRGGAREVLAKPPDPRRIAELAGSLARHRTRALPVPPPAGTAEIVGGSARMMPVFRAVGHAADSDATVLLTGESGTGKEMIARALHRGSARAARPFVAINCAAIPENLLESELFGHEKGAFTGAIARRVGRFERAHGGTLFLDEIGDMSMALQSKILRALQEREVERVGGLDPVPIDVRVIAATNRDLATAVAEGRFREDLFYRLAVVVVELPPLRERGADVDLLAGHFVAHFARQHGRPLRSIALPVFEVLRAHRWPGNVRQLRNALERAVVMSSGETLLPQHLPPDISQATGRDGERDPLPPDAAECTLAEIERRMIGLAMRLAGNNLTVAAQRLGIHRNTLRRKLADFGPADGGER